MTTMAEFTITKKISFKDKMKFFEQEIADQTKQPKKQTGRKFSYLDDHEVEKMKKDEAKKMNGSSQNTMMQSMHELIDPGIDDQDYLKSLANSTSANSSPSKRIRAYRPPKEDAIIKRRSSEGCDFSHLRQCRDNAGPEPAIVASRCKPLRSVNKVQITITGTSRYPIGRYRMNSIDAGTAARMRAQRSNSLNEPVPRRRLEDDLIRIISNGAQDDDVPDDRSDYSSYSQKDASLNVEERHNDRQLRDDVNDCGRPRDDYNDSRTHGHDNVQSWAHDNATRSRTSSANTSYHSDSSYQTAPEIPQQRTNNQHYENNRKNGSSLPCYIADTQQPTYSHTDKNLQQTTYSRPTRNQMSSFGSPHHQTPKMGIGSHQLQHSVQSRSPQHQQYSTSLPRYVQTQMDNQNCDRRGSAEHLQQHHNGHGSRENVSIDQRSWGGSSGGSDVSSVSSIDPPPCQYTVRERSRLVDEKVTRQVEEQIDEWTGETVLRTIEFIEKTIEHEVETTKQQMLEMRLEGVYNPDYKDLGL